MVGEAIAFVLRNLPALLLVLAFIGAAATRRGSAEAYLAWIRLLPIGASGLWSGFFHVFLPQIAAGLIGWETSPFQFEVGMADLAIGVAGVAAFWRPLDFKAAVVVIATVFLVGDAVGHVRQMLVEGNFAPGNAGVPFYADIIVPIVATALLLMAFWGRGRRTDMPTG